MKTKPLSAVELRKQKKARHEKRDDSVGMLKLCAKVIRESMDYLEYDEIREQHDAILAILR